MRIGHYAPKVAASGGIATYIRRTSQAQMHRGHEVIRFGRETGTSPSSSDIVRVADDTALFAEADTVDLDILHLHKSVETLPDDRVPTVRTMHGHQGGCPSGSRYLARPGRPCDRTYSVSGCLWGHFVDRCGSVRPQNLISNFSRIERELEQARHVPTYTVSDFLREQMVQAGCPSNQLRTIRSPAPKVEDGFTPLSRTGSPRFLYLGRLVPHKGLPWLLRAFSKAPPSVQLDVAGEGPQREEMNALAQELGIQSRVTFHGWVESSRVASLLRRARAVVFPSVWHEPAGLVTLEAAAAGRPVIASNVGGIPEYAHPEYAKLVDVRDVDGLTRAIGQLAHDTDEADRKGRAAFALARTTFSMEDFLDRLSRFYKEARQSA
jgi:glycosyltransferase involved in cell wall biosynthesis